MPQGVGVCSLNFGDSLSLLTLGPALLAEMFNNSNRHVINDGEFTATGGSSAFAHSDGHVINGGTFTATGSSISPAPAQYRAAQGSWNNATHGLSYGQQGK